MIGLREFRRQAFLMGSAFEFVLIAPQAQGEHLLDRSVAEVKRLEHLLTEFDPASQTSLINRAAGVEPVTVPEEVYQLILRSNSISQLTQGAFDITSGLLKRMYNFKGGHFIFPGRRQIREALTKVGYQNIALLEPRQVFLKHKGMHIGFGGIGKGYAADKVKAMLVEAGVTGGVINASGDLTAWGARLDGSPWRVGIADPEQADRTLLWLPVENASVATSGDYEQFFIKDGIRYSHTIDPKSGLPVKGIKSVTMVSPVAELSDALATAVFVMGVEVGLHFINQLPQTHALIVNNENKVFSSRKLNINFTR